MDSEQAGEVVSYEVGSGGPIPNYYPEIKPYAPTGRVMLDQQTVSALKDFLIDPEGRGSANVEPEYRELARVLSLALCQAQDGKGKDRHAGAGEAFEDQQIVQLGEWMKSTAFAVGQACKKSIESTRLPKDRAIAELLGSINYLAAAVIQLERT